MTFRVIGLLSELFWPTNWGSSSDVGVSLRTKLRLFQPIDPVLWFRVYGLKTLVVYGLGLRAQSYPPQNC